MADIVTLLLRAGALADYQRCADARFPWLLLPKHLASCFEHKRVTWIVSDSKRNRDSTRQGWTPKVEEQQIRRLKLRV
jgi:hypothetical protein